MDRNERHCKQIFAEQANLLKRASSVSGEQAEERSMQSCSGGEKYLYTRVLPDYFFKSTLFQKMLVGQNINILIYEY